MRPLLVAIALITYLGATPAPVTGAEAEAERPRIRFGIQTPQEHATWEDVLGAWQEAESVGFDSAWIYDHFIPIMGSKENPCLEGWTLLAALARETSRIQIGVLVTGNTYRNPALLAKMATTVDHLSSGRLVLGIGAAWFEPDHTAYGFDFYTARERAERLDEALTVITKLWTEDHPSFKGKYYTLKDAPFQPPPVQKPHPPIMIGGQGKKWIVPLVGRYAQAWNAVPRVSPDGIRERIEIIREECRRVGRDPCDVEVSVFLPLLAITKIPLAGPAVRLFARTRTDKHTASSVLADPPDGIAERIQTYIDAGVTHIILSLRPPFSRDLIRRFADEVMPRFR